MNKNDMNKHDNITFFLEEKENEYEYERVVNPRFGFRFKLEFERELFLKYSIAGQNFCV